MSFSTLSLCVSGCCDLLAMIMTLVTGDWQLAPGSHAPGPRSHESAGPVSGARPFKAGDRARLPTVGFKISAVQEVPNSARDGVLFSPASHVARVTSHQPVTEVQIMLRVFTGLGGAEASQVCC